MDRDKYLAEADKGLAMVGDLLAKARMGIPEQFNPLIVQMALEYGKVNALAAIAAGGVPVAGGLVGFVDEPSAVQVEVELPPGANGSGLVLPQ